MSGGVTGLPSPSVPSDAARLQDVTGNTQHYNPVTGGTPPGTVDFATTAALPACTYANGSSGVGATLTANSNGALASQDGQAIALNKRIAVWWQSSAQQNGFYYVSQVGDAGTPWILTRCTDADSAGELGYGTATVLNGTLYAGYTLQVNVAAAAITMGSTALPIVVYSISAAAAALQAQITANTNALASGQTPVYTPATLMSQGGCIALPWHIGTLNDGVDNAFIRSDGVVWFPAFGLAGAKPAWLFDSTALLDLDFTTQRYWAGTGFIDEASIPCVRGGATVYTLDNSNQPVGPFLNNVLERSNRGMAAWDARTNRFVNSAAPVTQTMTISNGLTYVVSCYGSGSVTITGAGTGVATQGSPLTFVSSGTSLTATIAGTVNFVNVEAYTSPSPPIITLGSPATRNHDYVSLDLSQFGWWGSGLTSFTFLAAFDAYAAATSTGTMWNLDDGTDNNRLTNNYIALTGNGQTGLTINAAGGGASGYDPALPYVIAPGRTQVFGMSINFTTHHIDVCLVDKVQGASPLASFTGISTPTGLRYLRFGTRAASAGVLNGFFKRGVLTGIYDPSNLVARATSLVNLF